MDSHQLDTKLNQEKADSKKRRASLIVNQLQESGYAAFVDSDGDVVFRTEDLAFFISLDEDDEEYYRVVLPGVDELTDERFEAQMETILEINKKCKCVKCFSVKSNEIWITVDACYSETRQFNKVLPQIIAAMDGAYRLYCARILLATSEK